MIKKTDTSAIQPYLKDASNFSGGRADAVFVPESKEELVQLLKDNDEPVTVSGARTGLTASGVALSGIVISTEKLKGLEGPDQDGVLKCGPAVRIQEIQKHLAGSAWFYPPNPTETLASLGGTLATNASGSRSYKWGATRDYVHEVEIILVDGRCARVCRGETIDHPLVLDDGSEIVFPDIQYVSPLCKNAAGFFVQPGMDWIDLLIGSDGTLCLFCEIQLKLIPSPAQFISGVLFCQDEEFCWKLVETIRETDKAKLSPCALEYFDYFSLEKLRSEFPDIPADARAALFFEQDISESDDYDGCLEIWFDFLEQHNVSTETTWFAQTQADVEKFHEFRHRVPLIVNEENSRAGRVKLGTDMAVPDSRLLDLMQFYRDTLQESGLSHVVFGHIGDNHLHVNLLPEAAQQDSAKTVYKKFVDRVLQWGGTVSAEHGIGKLKKEYYHQMVGVEFLENLKAIKNCFDPKGLLGQNNLF